MRRSLLQHCLHQTQTTSCLSCKKRLHFVKKKTRQENDDPPASCGCCDMYVRTTWPQKKSRIKQNNPRPTPAPLASANTYYVNRAIQIRVNVSRTALPGQHHSVLVSSVLFHRPGCAHHYCIIVIACMECARNTRVARSGLYTKASYVICRATDHNQEYTQ